MKPTILFLFNSSNYAPQPWIDDGRFSVVSVDYDDTDHSGAHKLDDSHTRLNIDLSAPFALGNIKRALDTLGIALPSLVVSFAPCTDLAVSGAAHFERKRRENPRFQEDAIRAAKLASKFGCAYAVENPVSVLSTKWRKPDTCFHPYNYGGYLADDDKHPDFPEVYPPRDAYPKKTCLWTGNGFVIPQHKTVTHQNGASPAHLKLGGKSARTKYIRSLTPRGLAQAIYEANRD